MSNGIHKGGMNRKIAVGSFIAVAMVLLVLGSIQPVGAWTRIAPIHINNTGGNAQAYYPVKLFVPYDSDMNSNFSDLRVVENETYNFIPYWIENKSDGEWCVLWFNATYIPANSWCNDTYYLLYGNASASSASDGEATFEFFDDDFEAESGEYSGAWCWFQDPRAVHYIGNHNRTYVGWVNPDGDVRIASIDHDTGEKQVVTLHTGLEVDDHAAPAILVRNDSRLLVAYTGHDDSILRWRISTNPEDITSWGPEKTKSFSGAVTYPNLVQLSAENNKIYVFLRGPGKQKWLYCTSDDGGETFGSPTTLISIGTGEHQYLKITTNGVDKIYFAHSGHPHFETPSIYYFYYYNNSLYKVNGTKIGDVPDDLPISRSQMDLVYDASAENHYKAWIWDIAMDGDTPYLAFVTFPAGADEDHRYNYGRWTGSAWETHEVVSAGGKINNAWYSGGISIDKSDVNTIYYSKEFSGKWIIQKRTTSDGGSTWSEPVNISSKTNYTHNVRPIVPRNPHPSLKVLWMYGEYNYYTDYETVIEPITTHDPIVSKWYMEGSPTIVDSTIELNGDDDIYSKDTFGVGYAVIAKAKADEQDTTFVKFGGKGIDPTVSCSISNSDYDYNDVFNRFRTTTRTEDGITRSHHNGSDFRDTYYQYEIARVIGKVKFRQGDTWLAEHTTNLSEDSLPVGAAVWDSSQSSTLTIDWILVRKYADPEPTAQLGTEQNIDFGGCTTPTITNLTNSTPTTNSVIITWTTNQSADNRVKYSKNPDLSDYSWSSWDNDTTSVSITLTGLEANTTYYYQAWSYNGTNSSCYTVEPSSQPYRSFTTQSSGGGAYTITLAQGYNMLGWTSTTSKTSSELCSIVPNCSYVYKKNPDGSWTSKQCGLPGGDFTVSRGFGFLAYITQECEWTRDE